VPVPYTVGQLPISNRYVRFAPKADIPESRRILHGFLIGPERTPCAPAAGSSSLDPVAEPPIYFDVFAAEKCGPQTGAQHKDFDFLKKTVT
jgi:hypothetical protein